MPGRNGASWSIALLFVVLTAAPAAHASPRAALVEARLIAARDVTSEQPSPPPVDGYFRLTFRVEKVLVGSPGADRLEWTRITAQPVVGRRYYLVVGRDGPDPQVTWSSLAGRGLCLDPQTAREFGLTRAVRRLVETDPCRVPWGR